jgi:transposase-like protein
VQRCRNHKIRNVIERLPEEQKDQVKTAMRPAYRLESKEGIARLKKLAEWLEQEQPAPAVRLRDAAMILRRVASSFLATEKNSRRVMGWKDLWQLKSILGREKAAIKQEVA